MLINRNRLVVLTGLQIFICYIQLTQQQTPNNATTPSASAAATTIAPPAPTLATTLLAIASFGSTTKNGPVQPLETTTAPQGQIGGGMVVNIPKCNDPVNLTGLGLPQWYIDFWRAKEASVCNLPYFNWSSDYRTLLSTIDKTTLQEVPWTRACDVNWDYAKLHIYADYYHCFYRLTPFPGENGGPRGAPEGTPQKMVHIITFLCSPIAFFTFMCGMYVIRKILISDDSHLFIYHAVLIFADVCCYVLDSSHVTDFAQWAMTPMCYTSKYLAAGPFTNFVPLTWVAHESAAFGLSNIVQALLAADRALSLTYPLWYRANAGTGNTLKVIGVALLINTIVWGGQLANTEPWQQFIIQGTKDSKFYWDTFSGQMALFGAIRAIIFIVSWFVQFGGCLVVFLKVWKLKRSRNDTGKGGGISLVPCYLLVGTCFMNLAGCLTMSLYMLLFYIVWPLQQSIAGKFNGAQLTFVPILNNIGFYVHCIVCRQYREAVADMVIETARRTVALATCTPYKPRKKGGRGGESSSGSHSSSSSSISRTTKQSQVGPSSEIQKDED